MKMKTEWDKRRSVEQMTEGLVEMNKWKAQL